MNQQVIYHSDNVRTIPVIANRKITTKSSNKVNTGASQLAYIT